MIATSLNSAVAGMLQAEAVPNDGKGSTSLSPYFAPMYEVIIGGLATLIVFGLLYKFAWPAIAKSMSDRTERIQHDLDSSKAERVQAEADAAEIRTSLGDIDAERSRIAAEANDQAEALLAEGRARLATEMAEVEARAEAEFAAAAERSGDTLRADIARYSSSAIEMSVQGTLDDAAQHELIEGFISRVGAQSGATA